MLRWLKKITGRLLGKKEGDIVTITADIKENLAKIEALVEKTQALTEALELQAAALIGQAPEGAKKVRKPRTVGQKPKATPQGKTSLHQAPAEKKHGGRPKGSLNKKTLAKLAEQQPATPANPGNDGDGEDKCPNCGNLVPECVCQRVQGAMAAVDKH